MYAVGRGMQKDDAEAMKWPQQSANKGNDAAQNNLGAMYSNGRGVVKDDVEALKWFQRAAEQGYPLGQFNVGNAYASGHGAAKDAALSYMWYSLALKGLSGEIREGALKGREKVKAELTPEQVAGSEQLAQNWKPKAPGP